MFINHSYNEYHHVLTTASKWSLHHAMIQWKGCMELRLNFGHIVNICIHE